MNSFSKILKLSSFSIFKRNLRTYPRYFFSNNKNENPKLTKVEDFESLLSENENKPSLNPESQNLNMNNQNQQQTNENSDEQENNNSFSTHVNKRVF